MNQSAVFKPQCGPAPLHSSIDFHGGDLEEVDEDFFETPGFDKAKDRLYLKLEVGMGSIDIYFD